METLKVHVRIGSDGMLRLNVPVGITNVDAEVLVNLPNHISIEEWHAFVDKTAGSLADDPIERLPQRDYEQRA